MPDEGLGLVIDGEHLATLERAEPTPTSFRLTDTSSLPKEWMSAIPPRNQGSFSCCVGGGLSGCFEHRQWVETGAFIRLSMWQAYIASQRECGMIGSDRGASLAGALRAANKVGVCRNALCPMPSRYTTTIPAEAVADAAQHKHVETTWDARLWSKAVDWATNRDAILIGGLWTDRHSRLTAENWVETPDIYAGNARGYHCRHVCGFTTLAGKLALLVRNTHGDKFGRNGVTVMPAETWSMLNRDPNWVALIVGDIDERVPQRRSWSDSQPGDVC